jgi:hypothetical protein
MGKIVTLVTMSLTTCAKRSKIHNIVQVDQLNGNTRDKLIN